MKTVFISVFSNFVVRNILATDFLKILSSRDVRIVILAPVSEKKYLEKHFGQANVIVEGVVIPPLSRTKIFFGFLSRALLDTNTVKIFLRLRLKLNTFFGMVQYFLSSVLTALFGHSRLAKSVLRSLDYYFLPKDRFGVYFDQYNPVLVFSTDITDRSEGESDLDLIRESKKRGIFVVGMVRSWDNLTGRGIVREVPDRIIVQNEIMKEECKKYNGTIEKNMEIVGIAHYDNYLNMAVTPRDIFFNKVGLDPNKKTVLFVTIADGFLQKQFSKDSISYNEYALELLKHLDPDKIQILVRLPVIGKADVSNLKLPSNFRLDYPEALFSKGELDKNADQHLVDSICNSDVVLPGPSTIAMDALFFDKPVVLIGFDEMKDVGEKESIRKFFKLEHLQPLIKSKGVRIAYNENELSKYLNDYLSNPVLNLDERKKIAEEICWKRDGGSAERLAKFVLKFCV